MSITPKLHFHGDVTHHPPTPHPDSPTQPVPYVPAADLVTAVNLAIFLRRPLLLEGEAGCGKTQLASAVAYELGLPFYAWYVRSTSKAQEGLYQYDAILRLHDVQTHQFEQVAKDKTGEVAPAGQRTRNPSNPIDYRKLGALGKAFQLQDRPAVVLIDEIDKADIDFPNDLLAVLDAPWKFDIPETGETIAANPEHRPIVIITSNKEKGNLPAPFLRRCIYFFVDFPDDEQRLQAIVDAHYQTRNTTPPPPKLATAAIRRFLHLRREGDLHKRPGTSEFLDWLEALRTFTPKPFSAAKLTDTQSVPYPELLFKLHADWQRYNIRS